MAGDDPLILGIDAGTGSIRALLFDLKGTIVAAASNPTPTRQLAAGAAEHDPQELVDTAFAAIQKIIGQIDDPKRIRSIGIASMGEAGVLLDQHNKPVHPVIAWYDSRPAGELDALLWRSDAALWSRITGLCPDPTFTLLKILWLKANKPEAFHRGRCYLHVADWLIFNLTGQQVTDTSLASRTMLLDLAAGNWSKPLADEAGVPVDLFADLVPQAHPVGTLLPDVAQALGLDESCIVATGGHDHTCGLLAIGADHPGVVMDSMGTAEALSFTLAQPSLDGQLAEQGFNQGRLQVDEPFFYIFGGLPTSAAAVEWFRTRVADDRSHDELIEAARSVPPGCNGTLFLPHLRIGSPPYPDPVSRGAFLGLADDSDLSTLYRAVLEGLALDAANMLTLMLDNMNVAKPERLLAIGGSTRNRLLMQIKADLFGQPIEIADMPEAVSLGAAMLGGLAAGLYQNLDQARGFMAIGNERFDPDPSWPEQDKAQLRQLYAETYAAIRNIHARLAI